MQRDRINLGQAVKLSYTSKVPNSAERVVDETGSELQSFSDLVVTNNSRWGIIPSLSAVASGTRLVLAYDYELDEDSVPAVADFTVKVGRERGGGQRRGGR